MFDSAPLALDLRRSQKPIKPIIPDASSPAVIAYTEGTNAHHRKQLRKCC
jgi:hypothetical protein